MTLSIKPTYLNGRPVVNGYVVPWFVAWYLGDKQVDERVPGAKPSFPTTDFGKLVQARKRNLCWICGNPLGANKAFVFGPASAITRSSSEPPSHLACAGYAVTICPYLINPKHEQAGHKRPRKQGEEILSAIEPHNPGLAVIWVTKRYELHWPAPKLAVFCPIDAPVAIQYWREGRKATYKEVADAMQASIQRNDMMNSKNDIRELAFRVKSLMDWAGEPP
jgi:hypothetical protein